MRPDLSVLLRFAIFLRPKYVIAQERWHIACCPDVGLRLRFQSATEGGPSSRVVIAVAVQIFLPEDEEEEQEDKSFKF